MKNPSKRTAQRIRGSQRKSETCSSAAPTFLGWASGNPIADPRDSSEKNTMQLLQRFPINKPVTATKLWAYCRKRMFTLIYLLQKRRLNVLKCIAKKFLRETWKLHKYLENWQSEDFCIFWSKQLCIKWNKFVCYKVWRQPVMKF